MGQVLRCLLEFEHSRNRRELGGGESLDTAEERHDLHCGTITFPDLKELPPELSLSVLSYLNATDLCLAACVWQGLAEDEILWHGLCKDQWGYATVYRHSHGPNVSFRKIYMSLDEGTLTFNANPQMGMTYFFKNGLLDDKPAEIALFFHKTNSLNRRQLRSYLDTRLRLCSSLNPSTCVYRLWLSTTSILPLISRNFLRSLRAMHRLFRRDVLDRLIELHNYENQFLPNALRKFFGTIQAPNDRGNYLHVILEKFSNRFCQCNPRLKLTPDTVYVLCYSLILLSVDLCSPSVKNKMSKREFIRNVRNAIQRPDDELAGHLYDNIYLRGHIAPATDTA